MTTNVGSPYLPASAGETKEFELASSRTFLKSVIIYFSTTLLFSLVFGFYDLNAGFTVKLLSDPNNLGSSDFLIRYAELYGFDGLSHVTFVGCALSSALTTLWLSSQTLANYRGTVVATGNGKEIDSRAYLGTAISVVISAVLVWACYFKGVALIGEEYLGSARYTLWYLFPILSFSVVLSISVSAFSVGAIFLKLKGR